MLTVTLLAEAVMFPPSPSETVWIEPSTAIQTRLSVAVVPEGIGPGMIAAIPRSPPVRESPKPPAPTWRFRLSSPIVRSVAPFKSEVPSFREDRSIVLVAMAKSADPVIRLKMFRLESEPVIRRRRAVELIVRSTGTGRLRLD